MHSQTVYVQQNADREAEKSALDCPLVSTFLRGLIFDGCNPIIVVFSAYDLILQ